VVGDSHANRLFFGLQNADPNRSYVNLGRGTCLPFLEFDAAWNGDELVCPETNRDILAAAVGSGAGTVVLHAFFVRAHENREIENRGDFDTQAQRTLRYLSESGVDAVVVLDAPVMPFHPATCVRRPAVKWLARSPCSFPSQDWADRVASTNAALRNAASGLDHITFFDPSDVLCDSKACNAVRGRELLYMDTHHLSAAGGELVATELLRSLAARHESLAESHADKP
jgi:hypothetical protein